MASYDDIINGSFKAVGAPPSYITPAYNPADYSSLYASSPSRSVAGGITPAQLAAIQAVPGNSYQTPKNTPLNLPNQPTGYSYADTGDYGRATPAMQQLIALGGSGTPILGSTAASPAWGQFEQAYSDAANKPGTWMAQSRMQAQALMRQMALRNAGNPSGIPQPGGVPVAAARPQGLFDLLFGGGGSGKSNAGGGLAGLVTQPKMTPSQAYAAANAPKLNTSTGTGTNGYTYSNGVVTGVAPQYANMTPSQMYDAINAKAGNPTNTSGRGSLVSNTGSLI